jgi:hypothetical protein
MQSDADTVEDYLAELPEDRRATISAVRDVVNENLPAGYRETMAFGMIGWGIPLEDYPDTYNGQPLGIAALASQKNHMALYLMGLYGSEPEEVPLDVIGAVIAKITPAMYIERYEAARPQTKNGR